MVRSTSGNEYPSNMHRELQRRVSLSVRHSLPTLSTAVITDTLLICMLHFYFNQIDISRFAVTEISAAMMASAWMKPQCR